MPEIDFVRLEEDGSIHIYFKDFTLYIVPKEKVYDFKN